MTVENISIDVKTNADRAATKINALSLALERLEGTARTTQGAAQSVSGAMNSVAPAGANAASGAKSAARGIDDVAKSAKKAQSPMGNFISSLKRIAFYRMLRTIIKEISQAIKEGMDNLYEFSKANNDFGGIASSFDGLASAAQTMKNQLGATFGQILAAAAPILIQLMQLVTQLTQVFYPLAQAIAALEPVITAVISVVTELINVIISLFDLLGLNVGKIVAQDATAQWKDAKKAAGDYKKTILGFDEINRLNGPGGGGDNANAGDGNRFEITDGDGKKFEFKWLTKFMNLIQQALQKVKEFAKALGLIPETVPVTVDVKEGEKYQLPVFENQTVTVKYKVEQPLPSEIEEIKNLQSNPVVVALQFAVTGNPLPIINRIRAELLKLVSPSPIKVTVTENVTTKLAQMESVLSKTFSKAAEVTHTFAEEYEKSAKRVNEATAGIELGTQDAYNKIKNPLNDWVSHYQGCVEKYKKAAGDAIGANGDLQADTEKSYTKMKEPVSSWNSDYEKNVIKHLALQAAIMTGNAGLLADVLSTYEGIKNNTKSSLDSVEKNTTTHIESSKKSWGEWLVEFGTNQANTYAEMVSGSKSKMDEVETNTKSHLNANGKTWGEWLVAFGTDQSEAYAHMAQSAYDALFATEKNVSEYSYDTSKGILAAAADMVVNYNSAYSTWAQNTGKVFSTVFDKIKSFAQKISQAWDKIKNGTVDSNVSIDFGGFSGVEPTKNDNSSLVPFAGMGPFSMPMPLPMFASGGVHEPSMGSLFVAGEAGAEIVTNMGNGKTGVTNVEQMKEAVREGNFELLNVLQGGINLIVNAINEIDPDITLDGQSLADKMYHYNQQAANRYGAAMVT